MFEKTTHGCVLQLDWPSSSLSTFPGLQNAGQICLCPPFSRVADPDPDLDPHGFALIWVTGYGSGSRRAKITYKYRKKLIIIFMFWSAGCSFLRAEGFSCSLCVLYGGLGITKLQLLYLSKKYQIFFSCKIFQFLVIKTLDSELDPDRQLGKMLDPDPH